MHPRSFATLWKLYVKIVKIKSAFIRYISVICVPKTHPLTN